MTLLRQFSGRREAGEAGTDHDNVDIPWRAGHAS
jgi:hypothetical protein